MREGEVSGRAADASNGDESDDGGTGGANGANDESGNGWNSRRNDYSDSDACESNRCHTHSHSCRISHQPDAAWIHAFSLSVFVTNSPISRGSSICQNSE